VLDKPVAGLLADLKRRGMLKDTLVLCTTEFGRTPITQGIGAKAATTIRRRSRSGWQAPA